MGHCDSGVRHPLHRFDSLCGGVHLQRQLGAWFVSNEAPFGGVPLWLIVQPLEAVLLRN